VTVIGFEERLYNGSESSGEIQVVVAVLQGELSSPVVVRISTMDGTALSGEDYQSINQTLTFEQSNTRIFISVPILDDEFDEDNEDILASLALRPQDANPNIVIRPSEALLIITDDDGKINAHQYTTF